MGGLSKLQHALKIDQFCPKYSNNKTRKKHKVGCCKVQIHIHKANTRNQEIWLSHNINMYYLRFDRKSETGLSSVLLEKSSQFDN